MYQNNSKHTYRCPNCTNRQTSHRYGRKCWAARNFGVWQRWGSLRLHLDSWNRTKSNATHYQSSKTMTYMTWNVFTVWVLIIEVPTSTLIGSPHDSAVSSPSLTLQFMQHHGKNGDNHVNDVNGIVHSGAWNSGMANALPRPHAIRCNTLWPLWSSSLSTPDAEKKISPRPLLPGDAFGHSARLELDWGKTICLKVSTWFFWNPFKVQPS